MSTGPEHYLAAVALLHDAAEQPATDLRLIATLAAAQVNATLALAAATARQQPPDLGWHSALASGHTPTLSEPPIPPKEHH